MSIQSRIESGVLRMASALPRPLQRLAAGAPRKVDGQDLDLEVQLALRLMALNPQASFETLPVDQARRAILHESRLVAGATIELPEVRDLDIPTDGGLVAARLYLPDDEHRSGGLLVYFHGGGWVVGDLDTHDNTCRFLAKHAHSPVLSVDYRRAPEDPFPAAVDDALAAFSYALENASSLGAPSGAVAVGGDSAGGNLAAVVSQLATAKGKLPAFQLLFYPVTDLSTKTASYHLFSKGYFLTESQMDWYRDLYLSDPADVSDPRVSPLLAGDLSGLPPAFVATAGFDPLRDEGEAYARRLAEARVPVVLRRYSGLIHGFVNAIGLGRSGREATLEAAVALRTALTLASR